MDFGDLIQAVLTCAQPWEEALKSTTGKAGLGWRFWGWRWGRKCRNDAKAIGDDYLKIETTKFLEYWASEQQMPPTEIPKAGKSRQLNSPWPIVLYVMLRSEFGMTRKEALSVPVKEANAIWAVRRDEEGRISLATAQAGIASIIHRCWRESHAERN